MNNVIGGIPNRPFVPSKVNGVADSTNETPDGQSFAKMLEEAKLTTTKGVGIDPEIYDDLVAITGEIKNGVKNLSQNSSNTEIQKEKNEVQELLDRQNVLAANGYVKPFVKGNLSDKFRH